MISRYETPYIKDKESLLFEYIKYQKLHYIKVSIHNL